MKLTLSIFVLVLGILPAQDVEPTPERAIASLVRELVVELPYRVQNGAALSIAVDQRADHRLVERLVASLLQEGFRIEARQSGATNGVPLLVATSDSGRIGTIRVVAGDYAVERGFGRAAWVDSQKDEDVIVVTGAPSATAKMSLDSAHAKLRSTLRDRFPALANTAAFERYASRQPTTSFVAERTIAGRKHYEAWLMAEPSFDRLARAERTALRIDRRSPWIRSAGIAIAGCALFVLYLRADLRTRGFKTTRLRFVFGTLFAALSLGLWSVSL